MSTPLIVPHQPQPFIQLPHYKFISTNPNIAKKPSKQTFNQRIALNQGAISLIVKQIQNKANRESILGGARKGQIEPREIMRMLRRNVEAFASSEKPVDFKPRDSAPLSEKRGESIRMKQILQEIKALLQQSTKSLTNIKSETLNFLINSIEEVGLELPKQTVEQLLTLVRSIINLSSTQLITSNKSKYRVLVIFLLYTGKLNESFNTSQREAKLKAYFDRLIDLNLSGLVDEIKENKNQLRLSDNDVQKLSGLTKTEAPDEKPTEPTTKAKSKEEIKQDGIQKLLTGENPSEAEIKAITVPELKKIAKELGIDIAPNTKKDQIVDLILDLGQVLTSTAHTPQPPRSQAMINKENNALLKIESGVRPLPAEIDAVSKTKLMDMATDAGLDFPNNISKNDLIDLIIENPIITGSEAFPLEEREGSGRKVGKKTRKIGCGCGKMKNRDKYKRFLK